MSGKIAHKTRHTWRSSDIRAEQKIDFSAFLLSKRVLTGLKRAGFKRPSPVQVKSIPLGRCGVDMIIQSKSGTGKTCVFAVIALEGLSDIPHTQVLILTPTREIAYQSCSVIRTIGNEIADLQCHCYIGGTSVRTDIESTKDCQIAVGTPGRIKQLIEMKCLATGCIRLLVLDEADNMLHKSFLDDVNWIFNHLPLRKQVLATSATYPEALKEKLKEYMRNPSLVQVSENELALKGVTQFYYVISDHALANVVFQRKQKVVWEILNNVDFGQCLIFCNFITRVDAICEWLNGEGYSTAKISSSEDQQTRLQTMEQLKMFQCKVLVTSDLTARGIDASNVDLVINLDLPRHLETYLHRIGRAGRYGTKAISITLVCDGYEEKNFGEFEINGLFQAYPLPNTIPRDLAMWTHRQIKAVEPSLLKKSVADIEKLAFKSEQVNQEGNDPCSEKSETESEESSTDEDSFEKVEVEIVSELGSSAESHVTNSLTNGSCLHDSAKDAEVFELSTEAIAELDCSKTIDSDIVSPMSPDHEDFVKLELLPEIVVSSPQQKLDDVLQCDDRLVAEAKNVLSSSSSQDAVEDSKELSADDVGHHTTGEVDSRQEESTSESALEGLHAEPIEVHDPDIASTEPSQDVGSNNLKGESSRNDDGENHVQNFLFSHHHEKSKVQDTKQGNDQKISKFFQGCFNAKHFTPEYFSFDTILTKLRDSELESPPSESTNLNDLSVGQDFGSSHVSFFESHLSKNKKKFKNNLVKDAKLRSSAEEMEKIDMSLIEDVTVTEIQDGVNPNIKVEANKSIESSVSAKEAEMCKTSDRTYVTIKRLEPIHTEQMFPSSNKKDSDINDCVVKKTSKENRQGIKKSTNVTSPKLKTTTPQKVEKTSPKRNLLPQKEKAKSDTSLPARNMNKSFILTSTKAGEVVKKASEECSLVSQKDNEKPSTTLPVRNINGSSPRKNEQFPTKELRKNEIDGTKKEVYGKINKFYKAEVKADISDKEKNEKSDKGSTLSLQNNLLLTYTKKTNKVAQTSQSPDRKIRDKAHKKILKGDDFEEESFSTDDEFSRDYRTVSKFSTRRDVDKSRDYLRPSNDRYRDFHHDSSDSSFEHSYHRSGHRHHQERYEDGTSKENNVSTRSRGYHMYEKESSRRHQERYGDGKENNRSSTSRGCRMYEQDSRSHRHHERYDDGSAKENNESSRSRGYHMHEKDSRSNRHHERCGDGTAEENNLKSRGDRMHEKDSRSHRHERYDDGTAEENNVISRSRGYRMHDKDSRSHRHERYDDSNAKENITSYRSRGCPMYEKDSRSSRYHHERYEDGTSKENNVSIRSSGHCMHEKEYRRRSMKHTECYNMSPPRSYYKTYSLPFDWPAVSRADFSRYLHNQAPHPSVMTGSHLGIKPQAYMDNPGCCYNKSDCIYEQLVYPKPLPCTMMCCDSFHSRGQELHNELLKYLRHRKHRH